MRIYLWDLYTFENLRNDLIWSDSLTHRFIRKSDSMPQNVMCKILDIFWKYEFTSFEQGSYASCAYERETCTSWCTVRKLRYYIIFFFDHFSAFRENIRNIVVYFFVYKNSFRNIVDHFEKIRCIQNWLCFFVFFLGFMRFTEKYLFFISFLRIIKNDLQGKSIQLCFWKRIRSFVFERILCSDHKKRCWKWNTFFPDRYLFFFHSFQKCWLYFWWSTIDLVCEENLCKNRTFSNFELTRLGTVYLASSQIRRKEIRSKRNSFEFISEYFCDRIHGFGFSESWNSLDKCMSSRKKREQKFFDQNILSNYFFTHFCMYRVKCILNMTESFLHIFMKWWISSF